MRGTRISYALIWLGAAPAIVNPAQTGVIARLPATSRAEMIATAKRFAAHQWTCSAVNVRAGCIRNYASDWKAGDKITGLPYNWGGADTPESFDRKILQGLAAGSHSRYGVSSCTAGVDCSGFICLCWGLHSHAYGTANLREIAGKPKYNWFSDMKPGDALNKAGSHVVLFAGYNTDGTINVYEASGSAARVVFRKARWSQFRGYIPLQYKAVDD